MVERGHVMVQVSIIDNGKRLVGRMCVRSTVGTICATVGAICALGLTERS